MWPVGLTESTLFEPPPQPATDQRPLEFEFVDLAEEREEPPVSNQVPLSDLDRRAHGGAGEPDPRSPSSVGNTPQLVQAEGGQVLDRGAPPQQVAPPAEQVPPPEPEPETEQPAEEPNEPMPEFEPEGAGESDPEQQQSRPQIQLPPSGSWALPPTAGGLTENPDRDGGRVDEGGISFDTQWYDWGPYADKMLRRIRRNWRIPEIARLGVSGRVRISLQSPNGQEFALIEREAQAWLGEPGLVNDEGRVVEAQTIERTELLVIPRDVILSIGQKYPRLYQNLFHYNQQTLRGLHELISGILFYPLKARVAGRLLHFVEEHGKEVEEGIQLDIKVSQNDFARLALGSRQRVNKIFRDWTNRGLVELRDEYLLVLDREALEAEIDLFE